jgi:hypothetical protein
MKKYGCEKVKFEDERFKCDTPCGYIMSDKKCGRLIKVEEVKNGNDQR